VTTTLADELLYTTINLVRMRENRTLGTGTGFFWTVRVDDERSAVTLITNKHVVQDCDQLVAVCHLADRDRPAPSGKLVNCSLAVNQDTVVMHPDPAVDLCAINFVGIIERAISQGTPVFYKTFKNQNVPTDSEWEKFDSIEDVLMIGCPQGIYDTLNNIPIVRRGITATPLGNRYCGRDEFMVDIACFPGSSGSPVVQVVRGYMDRDKNTFIMDAVRFHFLGILYAGPTITSSGEIVLSHRPKIEVTSMMHLGHVIRSSALGGMDGEIIRRANCIPMPIDVAPSAA